MRPSEAELDQLDDLLALAPPRSSQLRTPIPYDALVEAVEPLTEADYALEQQRMIEGRTTGRDRSQIANLRHTHHRLAQLLAMGMDEIKAAYLCNYTPTYVGILKSSPAFQELLAHYADTVTEEWRDFVSTASALNQDFLQELQERLTEKPESFTPSTLLEAVRTLSDRTGHAPVQKSVNVNVNADIGSRLAAAKERLRNVTPQ